MSLIAWYNRRSFMGEVYNLRPWRKCSVFGVTLDSCLSDHRYKACWSTGPEVVPGVCSRYLPVKPRAVYRTP